MAVNLYSNLKETKISKNLSLKLSIKHGKTITFLLIFKKWLAPRNVRLSRPIGNTFFLCLALQMWFFLLLFFFSTYKYKSCNLQLSSSIFYILAIIMSFYNTVIFNLHLQAPCINTGAETKCLK